MTHITESEVVIKEVVTGIQLGLDEISTRFQRIVVTMYEIWRNLEVGDPRSLPNPRRGGGDWRGR